MAEKSENLVTPEDKLVQAKELYGRGRRNYAVKAYNDAADDLSQVCNLYEEIYGPMSDELGMPYLLYAKSLIALAQGENKVVVPPEGEEEADDDEDEDDDNSAEADENKEGVDAKEPDEKKDADGKTDAEETHGKAHDEEGKNDKENEITDKGDEKTDKEDDKGGENGAEATKSESTDTTKTNGSKTDKPSTSNGIDHADSDEPDTNEDEDEAMADLHVAWETLELAAKIFEKQGESALPNLAEVYAELAGILFENSHFEIAISDYRKALEIQIKLPEDNRRIIAEIHYKIGLAYSMLHLFDDCVKELRQACELIEQEIDEEKSKEDQNDKTKELISDLEETKEDILAKIAEVEDIKQQSIEEVKLELSKIMSTDPNVSDGSGPSSSATAGGSSVSSSSAEKSTPKDISHLIKRKKPDTATGDEGSPAKRPAT